MDKIFPNCDKNTDENSRSFYVEHVIRNQVRFDTDGLSKKSYLFFLLASTILKNGDGAALISRDYGHCLKIKGIVPMTTPIPFIGSSAECVGEFRNH